MHAERESNLVHQKHTSDNSLIHLEEHLTHVNTDAYRIGNNLAQILRKWGQKVSPGRKAH
jgi:hypothetical protein